MTLQPWVGRALAAERAGDLARAAPPRPDRSAGAVRPRGPGRLALGAGRALVSLGWRLGGTAALPPAVRRRLA